MEDDGARRLFETARRVLRDTLGVSGDVTVDVGYRAEVFEARRDSAAPGSLTMSRWHGAPAGGADDIAGVLALWRDAAEPTSTDSADALAGLLRRDPGALIVAEADGRIVGSVIAGWDGWRGSIYRLAVAPDHRRRGLGQPVAARRRGAPARRSGVRRMHAIVVGSERPAPWRSGRRRTGSTRAGSSASPRGQLAARHSVTS